MKDIGHLIASRSIIALLIGCNLTLQTMSDAFGPRHLQRPSSPTPAIEPYEDRAFNNQGKWRAAPMLAK